MAISTVANMVIPKVVADSVQKKLGNLIKFLPLCEVNHEIQGNAGNTITVPTWSYIGNASDVAENTEIVAGEITASSIEVVVKKAVKDVAMTDESILGTGGAIVGEVEHQLAVAIANKIDGDIMAQATATAIVAGSIPVIPKQIATAEISQAGFATLRVYFGEDLEDTYLMVNPVEYGKILAMPEFVAVENGQAFMAGHVGNVMGLNIVVSGRLGAGKAVLIQTGALGLVMKREVNSESYRDMTYRTIRLGVDAHYASYIKNADRIAFIASLAPKTI